MAVTRVSRTAHGVRTSVCKRVTAPLFSRYEGVCFKFGVPNESPKRLLYRNNENLRFIFYSSFPNFRIKVTVVFVVVGDSPATELYVPTFRNTLSHFQRPCEQDL